MALTSPRGSYRFLPVTVVALTSLIVFVVMNPALLLTASTPSGGDMGAHVLGPAYLRDVLLPEGRILGWSNSWFAGFPAFYFYFPLPSLVIVALDLVLPYGVAFKLVTVAGLVAMAPGAWFLVRSAGFSRHIAAVAAAGTAAFVFMESYSIYGGNVASTLAGEFSYSISFALGLFYLGYLFRVVDGDRTAIPKAAVLFGVTALSHILTTLVLVIGSLALLGVAKRTKPALWATWFWAFAIAGFWALPLLARIGLTSDMAWVPLSRVEEVLPIEIWLLLGPAIGGAIWAMRVNRNMSALAVMAIVPVVYYPMPNILPEFLPALEGSFKLWNGRLLPYWYFGVVLFASIGFGATMVWLSRRLPDRMSMWFGRIAIALVSGIAAFFVFRTGVTVLATVVVVALGLLLVGATFAWPTVEMRSLLTALAASALALGSLSSVSFVDGWATWNYSGYEAKDGYAEYSALMDEMSALPPGRVQWEANSELNQYGTPMALMLFPYFSEDHPSMEGLFFESSLTTPFHFLNAGEMSARPSNPIPGLPYSTLDFERGKAHMQHFAVSYYVTFTEQATNAALADSDIELITESPPFTIFRLPESAMVEAATRQPVVFDPALAESDFEEAVTDWYVQPALLDTWFAEDGPEEWARVSGADAITETGAAGGTVTDVVVDDHRIEFTTDAVGVPHLVKVSYFPNWRADGAEGPWRAAPSLMVVVPTEETVVLEFRRTWAELGGIALTIGGLVGLVVWKVRSPRQDPPNP